MKKRKMMIIIMAVCLTVASVFTILMTNSYLIDVETADNVITIGNVQTSLSEGSFNTDSTYSLAAGTVVSKSPKVKNTGINDEYVFLKVTVPKRNVTLLQESGVDKGKKIDPKPDNPEVFRILTESNGTKLTNTDNASISNDVDFTIHKSAESTAGWKLISFTSGTSGTNYNTYIFGYNKKLKAAKNGSAAEETVTLFDKVQLKSFIDEELSGNGNTSLNDKNLVINIKAIAIQADDLGIDGLGEYLTDEQINTIYGIVNNKGDVS